MIKELLRSVCVIMLSVCMVAPAVAADKKDLTLEETSEANVSRRMKAFTPQKKKTYTRVAAHGKPMTFEQADKTYKVLIQNAVSLHNTMKSIQAQIDELESFRLTVLDKEISKERVKDFDECNEKWLADYFADSKKVWGKLKEETDNRVLAYDLNMAVSTEEMVEENATLLAGIDEQEQAEENDDNQNFESFDVNEVMEDAPEFDISFAVLNLFYPNQDAWGERKTPQTHSLPLWEDQKYLYNRDVWKPKYQKIVEFCQKEGHNLVLKEPKIDDATKYDYYFYEQVKSAHNAFIKATEAQGCLLTPAMKNPPKSAPRPLPPANEEFIAFTDENNQLNALYPQMPMNPSTEKNGAFEEGTLWEKYKADKYQNINKKGEFSAYFKVSQNNTITTLPAIKGIEGNRLSKYLLFKRDEQNATEAYESFLDDAANLKANVEETAATAGITIPLDVNYLDKKDLNRLFDSLKKGKESILAVIKKQMEANNEKLAPQSSYQDLQKQSSTVAGKMSEADSSENISYSASVINASGANKAEQNKAMRAMDIDVAYVNALEKDKKAEMLITEETALAYDESIKKARADQAAVALFDETSNKDKLAEIKAKNFHADSNKTCLGQTKKNLLNIDKIKIK